IMELRRRLVDEHGRSPLQKAALAVINNRPVFHRVLRAASVAQRPMVREGFIRHLPLFLSDAAGARSLPAIARKPLRDVVKEIDQPRSEQKAAFFAGCLIDFVYPEMGRAVLKILNRAGVEVVFPQGQTCCGAPARYAGAPDAAKQSVRANIEALLAEPVDWVVSACPTCTAGLKNEYVPALEAWGDEDLVEAARELATKTVDFSSLVKELADEGRLDLERDEPAGTLTYHDSCHLKRTLGADQPPREVLARSGFQLSEMFEADMCCGMGGLYTLKFPEISERILRRKLENVRGTGAGVVAVDCPGCIMQLRGGLDRQSKGNRIKVFHTAELLAERLD
ncbi:MAG: (Fe-S)-binding protein, partial [Proteobacteria bacterium]|nr:(Fe-S)-binding protein [Pseudomonadota bacterium]MBU1742524.1 (Fe-S)-binding protein [Pseudomonadota bacterium]